MEQFFVKIQDKKFIKGVWRPYVEALVLLLRCYESVLRYSLRWCYSSVLFCYRELLGKKRQAILTEGGL